MANAKKLPSGNYRARVYAGIENGKKIYKSFTAPTKKEAERLALEYVETEKTKQISFGSALAEYIRMKEAVLSASTIREYKRSLKSNFSPICEIPVDNLSQKDVQIFINNLAVNHSPKTCRDVHALITAVLKIYRPNFKLQTTLPQKVRPALCIPSDDDIKRLLAFLENNNPNLYNAVLLGALAPMRRSEICALLSEDITGDTIHVSRAMVRDENGRWVIKSPKSYAGDRFITLPQFVIKRFENKTGVLVPLTPTTITNEFIRTRKRLGLPPFRFHDLRHYGASMLHAMGVPDAYIMQRGGWGSDAVLKSVYRHALAQEQKAINDKINANFTEIYGK